MSSRSNPLTREEEEELAPFLNDIRKVEEICSTTLLTTHSRLTQKYFAETRDRKYKDLARAEEERHAFVLYAKSSDGRDYLNLNTDYILKQYEIILNKKEENTHTIIDALHTLHKYIKKDTIKQIIRITEVEKKRSDKHNVATLLEYNKTLIDNIRKSQNKLISTTVNPEDGYPSKRYLKNLYKIISEITIYPITHETLKEADLTDTDNNYSLGTFNTQKIYHTNRRHNQRRHHVHTIHPHQRTTTINNEYNCNKTKNKQHHNHKINSDTRTTEERR